VTGVFVGTFPDVEIELLSVLVPAFSSYRFVTKLPGSFAGLTVRVHRISGANRNLAIDRPIVDVDVFSTTGEADASTAARAIQTALLSYTSKTTTNGVIQRATTVSGPRWLPEANTTLIRYGATYEITIRSK
jgi:hypothetical protein